MISICIPVYNCEVQKLVDDLSNQCNLAGIPYEIILIDDASDQTYRLINNKLHQIGFVFYIELEKNIGRSAIRNQFLKYTKFNYLLFLDCDSVITDDQFIKRYVNSISENTALVCGGREYAEKPKNNILKLRWKYGVKRECFPAKLRIQKPYQSFLSNNFLIQKQIFEKILFDERIRNYGHEDTLFGYCLMQNKINIKHINNPLIHNYVENSDEFLKKTRQATENLYYIYSELKLGKDFIESVKLLKLYCYLKKYYLSKVLAIIFIVIQPILKWLLLKAGVLWLPIFDFYKVGYLCQIEFMPEKF
jgi:glycosyltransferase involved in cell wall biosynthesis